MKRKLGLNEEILKAICEVGEEFKAEIYLLGSRARGDWLIDSDIDLIIISNVFKDLEPAKRFSLIRLKLPKKASFDLLCYTEEEFKQLLAKKPIFKETLNKEAVKIHPVESSA